jgi:SNF2 family DNA or RNA helicase
VTLLANDVGLGKAIGAGLVAIELISRERVSRTLIVCPKLLGPQWQDELKTKFDITAEIAVGEKLISSEPKELGAVITTYASARLYLDKIPEHRFQMLILDEAHKLRNLYGFDPPPQVTVRVRKALEDRRFAYVLMLTATPIQNRLWDLYSLVDLLTVARGHQNPAQISRMWEVAKQRPPWRTFELSPALSSALSASGAEAIAPSLAGKGIDRALVHDEV